MTLDDENPCEWLVELLEENWFYENALNGGGGGSKPPPKLDGRIEESSDAEALVQLARWFFNRAHHARASETLDRGGLVGDRTTSEKKCRSLSDLEFEEVKGFRDLGFVFDRERLNPRIAKIIPGLRRRSIEEEEEEEEGMNGLRRPYLSEAWVMQRSAPPELNLFDRRSAAEMKEQLRFWARTVAFNIRQEC
ncbi:hypothetical protein QJS04_geneDACA010913 [Acorus gramineus]|uniref:Uncharacterized protein n=1 Tax=Acorus gramineus TaxID=55184 RepID=A0AAV9BJ61_ACOGR|nr:hypothetical protein QJS04_geneDACA010913 [Acorus gramineus]